MMRRILAGALILAGVLAAGARPMKWVSSTDDNQYRVDKVKLSDSASAAGSLPVGDRGAGTEFLGWGACFNELGWDALNMLPRATQAHILEQLFSPAGELALSIGRIPMNANDYARSWYSCDEVPADFNLKYFNIDRDRTAIIPFIKAAQDHNPGMRFWVSPWSPPTWMKINGDYPVRSDLAVNNMPERNQVALFADTVAECKGVFPPRLASSDYFIMDPRYLQAYADYFCRFIDEYAAAGIPVYMVMYQNEAWSYTNYPGCAWTPEGIITFNRDYLAPTMARRHPEVKVYFGTINTNRFDVIDRVLADPGARRAFAGVGLQWEGADILTRLRAKYPELTYVQTEGECGWGSFDRAAAEHTFERICTYLGGGCKEYTLWNVILADEGTSGWGWKQNALIRVDSSARTATYTPEYYAVRLFAEAVPAGSRILSARSGRDCTTPVLTAINPEGKLVIMAGNFTDSPVEFSAPVGKKYLNVVLPPHSLNSFTE
ncbi:MAG: beta-glycosidase [Muribaculaceae bacterium]|nr:beta-glycosidase [Muribaculaceae bacterium]